MVAEQSGNACKPATRLLFLCGFVLGACQHPTFDWQGRPDVALNDYSRAFDTAVGDRLDAAITTKELLQLTHKVRVLWLGDHHRDASAHTDQLALLRDLHRSGQKIALGLEAIGTQDEPLLAEFLAHRLTMDGLKEAIRVRWPESWLDSAFVDAVHYRDLLQFAATTDSPLFALEPTPRLPLHQRDEYIALRVQTAAQRHPDRLIVSMIGQAHLLGTGDLIARTGLTNVALGATPPAAIALAANSTTPRSGLVRSNGGLWFFANLLPTTR